MTFSPRKKYAGKFVTLRHAVVQEHGIPDGSENVGPVADFFESETPINGTILLVYSDLLCFS
jgi:hypothetical protein